MPPITVIIDVRKSVVDSVNRCITVIDVIKSWKSKGLKEPFETGHSSKVRQDPIDRIVRRLDVLNGAKTLQNLNLPGFDFHPLRGKPQRYSIHINGPWCITFEWHGDGPARVDLEQYH